MQKKKNNNNKLIKARKHKISKLADVFSHGDWKNIFPFIFFFLTREEEKLRVVK